MEILTLLKANIIKKKGAFISILLLTWLIVTVMTTFLSVKDNYDKGLENALEYSDSGDILEFIESDNLTDEMCAEVENHSLVERVKYYDAVICNKLYCGENDYYEDATFMNKLRGGICLYNEEFDGFENEIPPLNSGEIYLPLGLKSNMNCSVGDTFTVELIPGVTENFTVKGIVQEPATGAMTIGWKQVFISDEDFNRIIRICESLKAEDGKTDLKVTAMMIYQADDSALSSAKFQRQLNLDTGIISAGFGAINADQTLHYTTLMTDIIMDIVMVFAVFLFVIVLIVMSHSVATEIEIDYTTLGILKSQGFTQGKIRLLLVSQYILAQIIGIILGNVAAILLEGTVGSDCQTITGILPDKGISAGKGILLAVIILAVSAGIIFVKTRKVAAISPVRAISGGREEIFFDSRLNLPVSKRGLLASLSLRQFTAAKKKYAGIMFIAAILTFCMVTVNLTGIVLSSRSAVKAMGITVYDIQVYYNSVEKPDSWKEVDEIVASYSDIKEKNSKISVYVSLNGESLYCEAYEFPEYISSILKGRAPLYKNEIVITEMVAEALDLKMGDEVTLSYKTSEEKFLISGIYQSATDSGMAFAMNVDGIRSIGNENMGLRYYIIEDKSKTETIAEALNEKYGDYLAVNVFADDKNPIMTQYESVVNFLKIIIYTCSLLFAVIAVRMVCTKIFIQERTDIGIYKALGFTSNMLRVQFALRFLIIAIAGSVLGAVLSGLFSAKMLEVILKLTGVSRVMMEYEPISIVAPMILISAGFYVFAYFASGSIRKVEVRELVTE